ncbi:ShlB/FhaC/HecB family hemolysin secretion/activation protein [Ancylothrix sp. C2]|uniref:ShlB/FhaC/HecB family hemolysin secretion/activation protein n=1 Tax=Ancylothrix sp. D3o TaxID=2953691 RepID=UPI0021BB8424|nr:ShlB/FhaC/HecB family hemolysin secretion/activation protein [Ancylothrix sp. D3o]MCT7952732.1 ShlB/FhaC/HecB family hemolysin secretion/activation protein [Ancylothrix sp. D3o]
MENKTFYGILPAIKNSLFLPSLFLLWVPFVYLTKPAHSQTPIPPRETPLPLPAPIPAPPPALEIPIPTPPAPETAPDSPQTITVKAFDFQDNTALSDEELAELTKDYLNRPVTFADLFKVRDIITEAYIKAGYITTGAYIPPQEIDSENATIQIEIVEGKIEEIRVSGNSKLNPNYVKSRLELATTAPLNDKKLTEGLQLLRLNPLIDNIQAELLPGSDAGRNILQVNITEANHFNLSLKLDNNRSPSAGSLRRGATLSYNNIAGIGDNFSASYFNTDGSNQLDLSYQIPVNSRNGTVSFTYRTSDNTVIEEPFDELDINANYRSYELTFRQPVIQQIKNETIQELALGLTAQWQKSQTSILGYDAPLSPGADESGRTRISALRFFQEWTQRNAQQVFAARSEFSLGLGWRATVNNEPPDSRFFAWRGQAQWLRLLGENRSEPLYAPAILLRSNAQLATRALLPLEQFGLGGQTSVRGYRQDALLTDNGILGSAEFWLPVVRFPRQRAVLQIVPFIDVGAGWNSSGNESPNTNTFAGVGVGLQFLMGETLRARFDWGIPLVNIDSGDKTWQENGLYFSVEYNPF